VVISSALRAEIEAECARFPLARGAMLFALHRVQAEHGAVTPELAVELSELLEVRPIEVLEVVSFYNMIDASPGGRHRVRVCTNLSCSLAGARSLLRDVEEHLGLECGQTSDDGRINLGREECLGACGGAPMLWIDDAYHECIDLERARELLDGLE